ncbi:hypothetical protein [Novosphingobium sp. PC22D]|uniref:hypothetical protein n=1 Tax=Novosphingobium sp. PC22D TaxID=1962403 RepID=UPI001145632F|nr:hypothetical protein [Novosphingobium sp. PC22D]
MKVIAFSLLFSIAQLAFLLVLARALGNAGYAAFSVNMAIAVTVSALSSEWLRLVMARYSGVRGLRLRASLLRTSLVWVLGLASLPIALGLILAATAPAALVSPLDILAIAMLAGGATLAECTATYLRFNARTDTFLRFSGSRIAASGLAMVAAALADRSASSAGIAFAVASAGVSAIWIVRYWVPEKGRVDHRRLLRFVSIGFGLASSSIFTSFLLTATRLGLRNSLGATQSAATLLAIDLASRGQSVLGNAFTTWSAKSIYDAAHARRSNRADPAMWRATIVFMALWSCLGVGGTLVAMLAPLLVLGRDAYGGTGWVVALNLAGLVVLMARIYSIDLLLSAFARFRTIALASLPLALAIPAFWVFPGAAAWVLPSGVAASILVILAATWRERLVRRGLLLIIASAATVGGLYQAAAMLIEAIAPAAAWFALAALAAHLVYVAATSLSARKQLRG